MNRESSSLSPPTVYVRGCANMREWLSGRASPCQGESRGFDPRLPLPFPATSPSGKARLCKSCIQRFESARRLHKQTWHRSRLFPFFRESYSQLYSPGSLPMGQPHSYSAEAIVLKHSDLGEADRIVTLFTPYKGKVRAVAKGT